MRQASRPPPPHVAAIVHDGIRYEQVMNATLLGEEQVTGFLAGFDDRTGQRLWTLKVYEVRRDPAREADVQDIFFTRMEVTGEGRLVIENEAGNRYEIDPESRTVAVAG